MAGRSKHYLGKGCVMELFETLNIDFQYTDEKGTLTQLVHEGFNQVNVLESKKGCVRGNHFHKLSREAFYVVKGSVEVTLTRDGLTSIILFRKGDFFLIPTYTLHFMKFPEDCIMVALYDISVEKADGTKDIYEVKEHV